MMAWHAIFGWPVAFTSGGAVAGDCHQCAAGERCGDDRLYRVVRALLAKMLGARRLLPRLMLASLMVC
ncbi:hypothetical protein ACNKHP_18800 [Shigella boydii]